MSNAGPPDPLAFAEAELDRLHVGVVGFGYWGPNLLRVLHDLPGVEITHVCDARPEALARAGTFGPVATTTDADVVLLDPDVDAVVIATPVRSHYGLARDALRAGKHVFVEKPLAASLGDALELARLADEAGRVLMPGHTFLYSPPVNLARELIRGDELGRILFVSMSRVNLGLHQPDVSVVWDLGPHDFSILRYWLGEMPARVSALSRSCILDGIPDVAFINLEFPSGTVAHVELAWLAPSKLRRTAIVGAKKMLVYDDTSNEPIRVFDSRADLPDPHTFGEFRLTYRTGDIVSPRVDVIEPLQLELADFAAAVRTGSEPRSSALLGIDVVRVIEAVDRSLANGSAPVEIPEEPVAVHAG